MECAVNFSRNPPMIYSCECRRFFELSNYFIKELPKNKAIMTLLGAGEIQNQKMGPSPRILFSNTPDPKRNFESPEKYPGYSTPSTYQSSLAFSSPNSVTLKCARPQCNRDRYYLNGEVWDFCCINCSQLASLNKL